MLIFNNSIYCEYGHAQYWYQEHFKILWIIIYYLNFLLVVSFSYIQVVVLAVDDHYSNKLKINKWFIFTIFTSMWNIYDYVNTQIKHIEHRIKFKTHVEHTWKMNRTWKKRGTHETCKSHIKQAWNTDGTCKSHIKHAWNTHRTCKSHMKQKWNTHGMNGNHQLDLMRKRNYFIFL